MNEELKNITNQVNTSIAALEALYCELSGLQARLGNQMNGYDYLANTDSFSISWMMEQISIANHSIVKSMESVELIQKNLNFMIGEAK